MTETQAREQIVITALSYLGVTTGDARHKAMIDEYNKITPLPRGYRATYTDAWCAIFVSIIAQQIGYLDIIPPECGCEQMIRLFAAHPLSRWEERDDYVPKPGDIIMYYWRDGLDYATTDATGWADHVGIVTKVAGDTIHVVEGNNGRRVAMREIKVNGRFIRGYCLPAYWTKATTGTLEPKYEAYTARFNTLDEMPDWAVDHIRDLCDAKAITGKTKARDKEGYPIDMNLSLDMVRILTIMERRISHLFSDGK